LQKPKSSPDEVFGTQNPPNRTEISPDSGSTLQQRDRAETAVGTNTDYRATAFWKRSELFYGRTETRR
jgi:hypothetical protein